MRAPTLVVNAGLGLIAALAPAHTAAQAVQLDGFPARTQPDAPCYYKFTAERFIDCSDGTVYDNLLDIFWLGDASCDNLGFGDGRGNYALATGETARLENHFDCGGASAIELSDRSQPGDWRLPTAAEWAVHSADAISRGCDFPAMVNDNGTDCYTDGTGSSFVGLFNDSDYWSASADPSSPSDAFVFSSGDGSLVGHPRSVAVPVIWPVRDGVGTSIRSGRVQIGLTSVATREDGPCVDSLSLTVERYLDCGNGTVWDLATGLIWLADPDCFLNVFWVDALSAAAGLEDGECGLSDGSEPGDWRLATEGEWDETIARAVALGCAGDLSTAGRTLTNTTGGGCLLEGPSPFADTTERFYWSSTANAGLVQYVDLLFGRTQPVVPNAPTGAYVWPVREAKR